MPRKRSTWGTIDSTSKDTHVMRWYENTPQGRKRRCETFHGTRKEAELLLAQRRIERALDKPTMTLGQVAETWYLPALESRVEQGKITQSSAELYRSAWFNLCEKWKRVPCDSVRPLAVQEWLDTMSKSQAQKALVVMRAVMEFAIRYELASEDKFSCKYEMPTSVKKRKQGILTLDEAQSMLAKIRGGVCEAPFLAACFGSCRTGESLGIRGDEIQTIERDGLVYAAIEICRRMPASGYKPVSELKTKESRRTIIIPPPYSERVIELSSREWFADRGDGLPMSKNKLIVQWQGVSDIPFANLRQTWRTLAQFEWGISYDTLELLMGHKLPGVSGKHYIKPTFDMLFDSFSESFRQNKAKNLH